MKLLYAADLIHGHIQDPVLNFFCLMSSVSSQESGERQPMTEHGMWMFADFFLLTLQVNWDIEQLIEVPFNMSWGPLTSPTPFSLGCYEKLNPPKPSQNQTVGSSLCGLLEIFDCLLSKAPIVFFCIRESLSLLLPTSNPLFKIFLRRLPTPSLALEHCVLPDPLLRTALPQS